MTAYENDNLFIPDEIKNMSVAELREAKEKMLQELLAQPRTKKTRKPSKRNLIFNF